MKGRPSKSDAELKASGTFRPDRHQHRAKADKVDSLPTPEGFDSEHLAKWEEVCDHLRAFEILAKQDSDSVMTYVVAIIMQRKAWAESLKGGDGVKDAVLIFEKMEKIIKPLREQFGFTPKARQGIQTKPKEVTKVDPMMEIMFGKTKLG